MDFLSQPPEPCDNGIVKSGCGCDENWIKAQDGTRLFVRTFFADAPVRGRVMLVHGLGEHSSRYLHVAETLIAHGFDVCACDLRGHGRSGGARGDVESYGALLDDLSRVFSQFETADAPIFIYGHSLGGQLALHFLLQRSPRVAGVISASPWLDLAFAPPRWKLWLARAAVRIRPRFTQETDVVPERLSRDQDFLRSLADADLVHHRISARMYAHLSGAASHLRTFVTEFPVPLMLLHGDSDPITSAVASRAFFEKLTCPDKTLRIYPGGLHETHNDLDRATVLRDVIEWMSARSPVTTRAAKAGASSS
ncbi:MAG: hypothetical protein QOD99_536 [Chthoniobacter sp.]|nr:hypothetical protein [Chthoniobacter sp.]